MGAFSIWALIFAAQAVFVVAQMFPRHGAMPLVQKGVGYWYLVVCAFQISWNFAFGFESFIASLVIIIFVWTGLLAIVASQYYVHKREQLAGEKHTLDQLVVAVSVCNSLRMDHCRNDTQCQSRGGAIECYCCNTIGYWYCYVSIPSCRGCVGYVRVKATKFHHCRSVGLGLWLDLRRIGQSHAEYLRDIRKRHSQRCPVRGARRYHHHCGSNCHPGNHGRHSMFHEEEAFRQRIVFRKTRTQER